MQKWLLWTLGIVITALALTCVLYWWGPPPTSILASDARVVHITYHNRGRSTEVSDPGLQERFCAALKGARPVNRGGPDKFAEYLSLEYADGTRSDILLKSDGDGGVLMSWDGWWFSASEMPSLLKAITTPGVSSGDTSRPK